MVNVKQLLIQLLNIVGDSDEYFVSGSLSFLPLLGNFRQPLHDVDAAISEELFQNLISVFNSEQRISYLRLSEVAVASNSTIAGVLWPRTGFVHVDGPNGLLDLSCYRRNKRGYIFTLGGGFTLEVPEMIKEGFRQLSWEGIRYQAGPPELAFIPKAVWYLQTESKSGGKERIESKHMEDIREMIKIIDWEFTQCLLERGGLRWLGRRLPRAIGRRVDPFQASEILSLRDRVADRGAA
jgi:hypothetical protein